MAAANLSFAAAVSEWVKEVPDRAERIWKQSTQQVNSAAVLNLSGGVVNVQTGFLRASERASNVSMPPIDPSAYPVGEGPYNLDSGQIELVIKSAKLGETIYLGWTAAYGPHLEYGSQHIAARGFVRLAAAQWQSIVNRVTVAAKAQSSVR